MGFLDSINTLKNNIVAAITSKTDPYSVKTEDVGGNLNNTLDLLAETATKPVTAVLPEGKTFGRIKNGDSIPAGLTLPELLQNILVETLVPIITEPTLEINIVPASTIQEVGTSFNLVLTANFNRGSIFQGWNGESTPRSGVVTGFVFYKNNSVVASQSQNSYTYQNQIVVLGLQNYKVSAQYADGPQPKDSEGNNYMAALPAGSLVQELSVEGVYPYYAKTNIISAYTKQPLVSMTDTQEIELVLVAEASIANRQGFQLPADWIQLNPLTQVLYFNPVSNQFDPQNKLSDFIETTVSVNSLSYKQYEYNGPERSSIKIKLVF